MPDPPPESLGGVMQTIFEGRSVKAATAGQLLLGSPEDTTGGGAESVGWLAIGTTARKLEIWLEVDSGGRHEASRALDIANETELDRDVLALAACPRCEGVNDGFIAGSDMVATNAQVAR